MKSRDSFDKMIRTKTQLRVLSNLPDVKGRRKVSKQRILLYDSILSTQVQGFKNWILQFDCAIALQAGESLKSLAQLDKVLLEILGNASGWSRTQTEIFVAGGGSVGDFGGFLASVFLRGVKLIQIPTTWLSAVDSAHGGKTALNIGKIKNQIGTFYPGSEVWLIRSFFENQSQTRLSDAFGEIAKICILDRALWKRSDFKWDQKGVWKNLPHLIEAKLKVVRKDPYETMGSRVFLNLGHTLGHALESDLGISHGHAVQLGLFFAIWWSQDQKLISPARAEKLRSELERRWGLDRHEIKKYPLPTKARLRRLILRDKKMGDGGLISFVALRGVGQPAVRRVHIDDLINSVYAYRSSF